MFPPEHTLYLPDGSATGLPLHLRLIPTCPQGFLMGSRGYSDNEEPRHRVIIPRSFYLGTYPVTQAQFACFLPEHENSFPGQPQHPVENMDWYQARDFMAWLKTRAQNLPSGWEPRLPCEAEWEYACRAGSQTEYWSGDGEAALREVGWYAGNSGSRRHPVGEKGKPNFWGLHELHGNVWEWCEDVYDASAFTKRPDGWLAAAWTRQDAGEDAAKKHLDRVLRGGSWFFTAGRCRAADRHGRPPRDRDWLQGFRVLLTVPSSEEPAKQGGGMEGTGGREDQSGDWKTGAGQGGLDDLRKPKSKPA